MSQQPRCIVFSQHMVSDVKGSPKKADANENVPELYLRAQERSCYKHVAIFFEIVAHAFWV